MCSKYHVLRRRPFAKAYSGLARSVALLFLCPLTITYSTCPHRLLRPRLLSFRFALTLRAIVAVFPTTLLERFLRSTKSENLSGAEALHVPLEAPSPRRGLSQSGQSTSRLICLA